MNIHVINNQSMYMHVSMREQHIIVLSISSPAVINGGGGGGHQLGKLWEPPQIRTEYIQCGIPSEFQSVKDVTAKPKRILTPRRN